eukprot:symbB.v1.2.008054.t1/scaffold502.1/size262339/8
MAATPSASSTDWYQSPVGASAWVRPDKESSEILLSVGSWCICSVGMMVFNKLAVLHFSAASRGPKRSLTQIFGVALVDKRVI